MFAESIALAAFLFCIICTCRTAHPLEVRPGRHQNAVFRRRICFLRQWIKLKATKIQRLTPWKQEIRSVELGVCPMQLFHFWSRDVHPVQNLLLCTEFHQNPPSWNCFTTIRDHPRSLCCWPQLPVKFHVNLIHRYEDSYLIFSHYLA